MAQLADTKVFNNINVTPHGWYWGIESSALPKNKITGVDIMGNALALWRSATGKVYAVEAYCPHMGAHFKEGSVEGESIKCAFHGWEFDSYGRCSKIPCKENADATHVVPPLKSYRTQEAFGLVWVHTLAFGEGDDSLVGPLPEFSEIGPDDELSIVVGPRSRRPCRPEVVMLNAIDAHHFNTVHPEASQLAEGMRLQAKSQGEHAIRLENSSLVTRETWVGRLLAPFYGDGPLTYFLDYWYGSTGVVTLGPRRARFYLLFPHRPTIDGGTEGVIVTLAKRRRGPFGRLRAKAWAFLTLSVGRYFEKGDREIFNSIRFAMRAPISADKPIIEFIRHLERQPILPLPWKTSDKEVES